MRDVGLGVKFGLAIHPTLDLAGFQRIDDGGKADKEVVFCFFRINAAFQLFGEIGESGFKGLFGASGDFVSHEDADARHGLPCAVQRQQSADFEEAGSDVHGLGSESPLFETVEDFSLGGAVVDDENFGVGFVHVVGFGGFRWFRNGLEKEKGLVDGNAAAAFDTAKTKRRPKGRNGGECLGWRRAAGCFSVVGGFIGLPFLCPFAGASCSVGLRGRLLGRGGRGACLVVLFLCPLLGGL